MAPRVARILLFLQILFFAPAVCAATKTCDPNTIYLYLRTIAGNLYTDTSNEAAANDLARWAREQIGVTFEQKTLFGKRQVVGSMVFVDMDFHYKISSITINPLRIGTEDIPPALRKVMRVRLDQIILGSLRYDRNSFVDSASAFLALKNRYEGWPTFWESAMMKRWNGLGPPITGIPENVRDTRISFIRKARSNEGLGFFEIRSGRLVGVRRENGLELKIQIDPEIDPSHEAWIPLNDILELRADPTQQERTRTMRDLFDGPKETKPVLDQNNDPGGTKARARALEIY